MIYQGILLTYIPTIMVHVIWIKWNISISVLENMICWMLKCMGQLCWTFNHNGRGDVDTMECFQCPIWPTFARKDICIYESNGKDLKPGSISSCGCHIVPIANPNSSNPDLEFRISFSGAENCNKTGIETGIRSKCVFTSFVKKFSIRFSVLVKILKKSVLLLR